MHVSLCTALGGGVKQRALQLAPSHCLATPAPAPARLSRRDREVTLMAHRQQPHPPQGTRTFQGNGNSTFCHYTALENLRREKEAQKPRFFSISRDSIRMWSAANTISQESGCKLPTPRPSCFLGAFRPHAEDSCLKTGSRQDTCAERMARRCV